MGRNHLGTRPPRDRDEVLEIEAVDVGGTSMVASLLTTLASQHGNAYSGSSPVPATQARTGRPRS